MIVVVSYFNHVPRHSSEAQSSTWDVSYKASNICNKNQQEEIVFTLNTIRRSLHSHCPITRNKKKNCHVSCVRGGGGRSALKSFWGLLFRTIYSYFQCSLYSHTRKSKIKRRTYSSKQGCESIDARGFYHIPTHRMERNTSRSNMLPLGTRTGISNIYLRTHFNV